MKFLIFNLCLIFCSNAFAGYMTKVDIEDCNKVGRRDHIKQSSCGQSCIRVPSDYICETFSEQDTNVNDIESPIFSKNEIETCSDRAECEEVNSSKICTDGDERVLMASDFSEIYCSKRTGFNQKVIRMYREDSVKKAADDASRSAREAMKASKLSKFNDAVSLLEKLRGPTALTPTEIKTLFLGIVEKLEKQ